jgi:hypothetical protein
MRSSCDGHKSRFVPKSPDIEKGHMTAVARPASGQEWPAQEHNRRAGRNANDPICKQEVTGSIPVGSMTKALQSGEFAARHPSSQVPIVWAAASFCCAGADRFQVVPGPADRGCLDRCDLLLIGQEVQDRRHHTGQPGRADRRRAAFGDHCSGHGSGLVTPRSTSEGVAETPALMPTPAAPMLRAADRARCHLGGTTGENAAA